MQTVPVKFGTIFPMFSFRAAGWSDVGGRANNEDSYLINERLGLFIVADGIGGHEKGEVASLFSSEELERLISTVNYNINEGETLDELLPGVQDLTSDEYLECAIAMINQKVFEMNEEQGASLLDPLKKKKRMGTTLVTLLCRGDKAYVSSVGDSRAYRMTPHALQLLTHDHSWVEERVREGKLTEDEALVHPKRNVITRSVGYKPHVLIDVDRFTIYPGERFLLCSDGLSGVLSESQLLAGCLGGNLWDACQGLVEKAKKLGSKDNITAVLVEAVKMKDEEQKELFSKVSEETIP
ncbi:MAG: serine/threonine-protein phosphatase [Deltaproteobacteria bacterium]|nr:serine/threonine-protein phosphatase [Deltaproteobacteria bacterium]